MCCLSRQHPRIRDSIDLEQYLAEVHLVTLYGSRRESMATALSRIIERHGRERRMTLVQSLRVAADILSRTDRLLTCNPEQANMICRLAPDVRALPLPIELDLPSREHYMVWHQRTQFSAAHRWLREQVRAAAQQRRANALG